MKSISIVQYTRGTAGTSDELKEIARHFQTAWSTAVAYVDDHTWLESEAEGNLMILQHNVSGVTAEDRRRLERVGEIRLGELVNRIRTIEVEPSSGATVIPRAFLGTVRILLLGLPVFDLISISTNSPICKRSTARSTSSLSSYPLSRTSSCGCSKRSQRVFKAPDMSHSIAIARSRAP